MDTPKQNQAYTVFFQGRKSDAIGVTYHMVELVYADTHEEAIKKLYEKYDHISNIIIDGNPYEQTEKQQ